MERELISSQVKDLEEQLLTWRRHMHMHPELSFQEYETSNYIESQLKSFGNGIEISRPTKTSVMAVIKGSKPGRTIALRADIDALPIQETNDLPFASVNPGVMHACGHDGHAAILLAVAKLISGIKDSLSGEVRLFFQHAEEVPPGGASEMLKAGVMDGVEEVYGLHISSNYKTCTFGLRSGALTSATDRFDIVIKGKGGHSAFPEECVDPVVVGAQIITALQTIISRQTAAIDPAVLSICKVNAGQAYNIIPGTMTLSGSTRTFNHKTRENLPKRMEQIIKGITDAYHADYEFSFDKGYGSVINDAGLTKHVEELLTGHFGKERVAEIDPLMPGEDFAVFSAVCPGCFIELGALNPEKKCDSPHHNSNYRMDEDALVYGVEYFVLLIKDRLSGSEKG